MNDEPIDNSAQYTPESWVSFRALITVSSTQPTVKTTSRVIITIASTIGTLRERRSDIIVPWLIVKRFRRCFPGSRARFTSPCLIVSAGLDNAQK